MTFKALKREHPRKVCVCRPHLREVGSGRVVSWICLQTFDGVGKAREALECLEQDGVTDAVLISTTSQIAIEGDMAAKYFSVLLGMEQ